jgi:hypothetical protein
MVVSARRLLQYFQLPDKTSCYILRYIYNFLRFFKIVMYLSYYFSWTPNNNLWHAEVPQKSLWEILFWSIKEIGMCVLHHVVHTKLTKSFSKVHSWTRILLVGCKQQCSSRFMSPGITRVSIGKQLSTLRKIKHFHIQG